MSRSGSSLSHCAAIWASFCCASTFRLRQSLAMCPSCTVNTWSPCSWRASSCIGLRRSQLLPFEADLKQGLETEPNLDRVLLCLWLHFWFCWLSFRTVPTDVFSSILATTSSKNSPSCVFSKRVSCSFCSDSAWVGELIFCGNLAISVSFGTLGQKWTDISHPPAWPCSWTEQEHLYRSMARFRLWKSFPLHEHA